MNKRKITRREFLRLSTVATAGAISAACGGGPESAPSPAAQAPEVSAATAPPAAPAEVAGPASKFSEAPMLSELVKQGKLPPVDERLPTNPAIIPVMETTGQYGGTIRRGFKGVSDRWGPTKVVQEGLVWYTEDLNLRPNIAEAWEPNEDASAWTFHLREGMRWSDGTPFDSGSIRWWYENELLNKEITPTIGRHWQTGSPKVVMQLETPDPFTVTFKFAHPNPLFPFKISWDQPFSPGHYMKQFHMQLTDDKARLEAQIKEAGFEAWDQYYIDRNWWYLNPDRPNVNPWLAQNPLSEELFVCERNPYFFGIDVDGNQLPYVDKVVHRLFESPEVLNLWVVNGEIDFQARHMNVGNYTLYKENEEQGDYQVYPGLSDDHTVITPNHTTRNERLREFFQTREVRIAMSLAVNREELNDLIFDGLATPRQYSPLPQSPQYYPKLSNAYIEYDPERANALLDAAGYSERDSEGFRLWKDGSGETISFVIEGTAQPGSPDEDGVQLIIRYFADVGIKASYKGLERSLYEEHWRSNNIECAYWGSGRSLLPIVDPAFFLGTGLDRPWALAWGKWRLDPTDPNAEEPPPNHWIRDIWAIWDQIEVEPDENKRNELFFKILDIWAEELPQIGYLGEKPWPIIVKNGLRNLRKDYRFPLSNPTKHEHLIPTSTYFWEEPDKHI